jgi:uncharacterized protein YbcC (UPF0753/DUF2309 family)
MMNYQEIKNAASVNDLSNAELENKLRKATKKIAPLWPLERFTAVNPYLGMSHQRFQEAAIDLAQTAGIKSTLPLAFYVKKYEAGVIKSTDITRAIEELDFSNDIKDLDAFVLDLKANVGREVTNKGLSTFADTVSQVKKEDWSRFMTDRISSFAAAHYDVNQANWKGKSVSNLFEAWKFEASIDRTAEIMGLKGFREIVKELPDNALNACRLALQQLEIPLQGINPYLFKLLTQHSGWAAHAARIDWESQLNGQAEHELLDFLAICLIWEATMMQCLADEASSEAWKKQCTLIAMKDKHKTLPKGFMYALIMQQAYDMASQKRLIAEFSVENTTAKPGTPTVQAIFCIDVRSEIFRRKLEKSYPDIETMGFAGFFGFPISFQKIGRSTTQPQCPVLLKPAFEIRESYNDANLDKEIAADTIIKKDLMQVWRTFKNGAVSCFSFVSPLGLFYLPKLITDSFGFTKPAGDLKNAIKAEGSKSESGVNISKQAETFDNSGLLLEEQLNLAEGALRAMSLTDGFAKMVLIVGHGANMVNNPHAAAYDCGACGGHAGDANAKVAAAVLNNLDVRTGLKSRGIVIPDTTHFVACLHETTTDHMAIYQESAIPRHLSSTIKALKKAFYQAGFATRTERFGRFKDVKLTDINQSIANRSKDWSQLRPEWGLAGCSNFIVAPRHRSSDHNLGGKSFLHTYDWKKDQGFAVLETIMTAPMVVTSWINLQYFGSTVDNKQFGSGNKTLHNITSGIGVIEGNSGDLRVGLPEQAVHDGVEFQHEPIRLSVVIEAPMEAINNVLHKNINIKQLCDNEWIYLFAMNEKGQISHQYGGDLEWKSTLA